MSGGAGYLLSKEAVVRFVNKGNQIIHYTFEPLSNF